MQQFEPGDPDWPLVVEDLLDTTRTMIGHADAAAVEALLDEAESMLPPRLREP
jgi:hypothetical protein